MDSIKDQLSRCSCFADADKILETRKATPSQKKLVEIAFANPTQKDVLLTSVIREMDGTKAEHGEDTPGAHDAETPKKEAEGADKVTSGSGNSGSQQSSGIEGTEKKGSDAADSDIKGLDKASGEDQMKEGMPGGMMPGVHPDIANTMMPKMNEMPPMNFPQQLQQMQYTVQEAIRKHVAPLQVEIRNLKEANVALDKKFQETQGHAGHNTMELKIPTSVIPPMTPRYMQETAPGSDANIPARGFDLEKRRQDMENMNKIISTSGSSAMYQ